MKTDPPVRARPAPGVEAISRLTLAVFRLNGLFLQWGDELLAPLDLTTARWQMLRVIARVGAPITAPQVGAAMGVTRQGAQKQLNLLFGQGLVRPRPNPAHKRSPLYTLTPMGRKLNQRAEALWAFHVADLAALLPAVQVPAVTATLESMLRQLQASAHEGEW